MRPNIATLGLTVIANIVSVFAQNMSFGADNFYRSDLVTIWPVSFPTIYQTTIKGNIFIRDNLTGSHNTPAIVVGHPMGAVKEQSANLYATKLAELGFITISLDLPYWGRSGGEPRNSVSPELYTEAFSAAVDFLGTQELVDRERIGALGICGSGGFVISAAKIDPRMKAVATMSMYDMGGVNRNGLDKSQSLEQRLSVIAASAAQRWNEVDGGKIQYTAGAPQTITNETDDVGREFYDFYRTSRGLFTAEGTLPNLTTHSTLTSYSKFMNFYPFNDIDTISPRPLLFISGDRSHSRGFSEEAYQLAAEPKELYWVKGVTHTDMYDRLDLIPFQKLSEFFWTNLV